MIKKIFKLFGFILLALVIAAIVVPIFYKDEIVENVKSEINKNVNAKVDFSDVNLSLFKSFPDFNFSIDQLSITGTNEFNNYTLLNADNIDISLDFMSVISSDRPLEIKSILINKPNINIKVLRNGQANYNITKDKSAAQEESTDDLNVLIQLRKYRIIDGTIIYDDRLGDHYVKMDNIDHEGEGEFTQEVFDITTSTSIKSLSAKSAGITYLKNAKSDIDLTLNTDLPNNKYTIKENSIVLNDLKLNVDGFVQLIGDKINMNINYDAPNNDFKNLLSMVPSAFTEDFQNVDASGSLQLDGFVKGTYDAKNEALPSFALNIEVKDGEFKYPDLPIGIKDIHTSATLNSPSSNLDNMVVDISDFNMELDNNPFSAKAKLWTLISDPHVDTDINGTIDLSKLAKAFPMEGISDLNGIVTSNLKANTSMSAIDSKNYESIDMTGDISLENFDYKSEETPRVQINNMNMNFSPRYVRLNEFDAQLGKSDFKVEGTVDNILAYFSPDKTMAGKITMRSELFDVNEWITVEESDQQSSEEVNVTKPDEVDVFDRFNFTVDAQINKMIYDIYELKDSKLIGNITPNKAEITNFETAIGESDFRVDGKITNISNYMYESEQLQGDINLTSKYINANEFLTTEELPEEDIEVIMVPEDIELNINADIGEVLYTNIPLKAIKGQIYVNDEVASIKNGSARTLGGDVTMNGKYNTQNIKEPQFDMQYTLNSLDYQNAFEKLNTFQSLAPIGKYIEGKFNTTIEMSGILGTDMLPDLTTLSAAGLLQTLDGTLKNFEPIQQFANKLNLDVLKSVNLKNTKNAFEIDNGQITVKEFDYSTNGIDMVISGSHGLNTEMKYTIKAKIPRNLIKNNAIGEAADKGLTLLKSQASKLGIDLNEGAFINVNALISGTMTNPKIKLELLGTDGEPASIDNIVDEVKKQAVEKATDVIEEKTGVDVENIEEEIAEVKEDLSAKADAEIESLMKKTEENIKKIELEAKKQADETRSNAQKLSDKTKAEGYKQADVLIEKAGSNIFKKKAAELAAKKLKAETDKKANQILIKGDAAADVITKTADKQISKLRNEANDQADAIRAKYK